MNWVVAGYNLAFAATTLIADVAADRVARRRIFILAAAGFAVGFLCTALALTILLVDIARIVSGAGGAGIMAAGGALLASNCDGAARNRTFAFMGTMAGVGIAGSPTLIGGLIALTGWRGSDRGFQRGGSLPDPVHRDRSAVVRAFTEHRAERADTCRTEVTCGH